MPAIKASIPNLPTNVLFVKSQEYSDFSAGIDKVAGKVLAKVGRSIIIVKFWKLELLALGEAWGPESLFRLRDQGRAAWR